MASAQSSLEQQASHQSDKEPRNGSAEVDRRPEMAEPGVEKTSEETPAQPPRTLRGFTWAVLVIGVFSAQFLFSLMNTIVADVQPRIIEDLGEIEKLTWITVGFDLGAVSASLLWGKLYGLFNNKVIFIASILVFEVGAAVCGAAPDMNAMIVGRVITGLGGNGIYIGTMNIVSSLTTIQERPLYLSFAGIAWGVGTLLGPIIGGSLTDSNATWRWSFYVNICIGGLLSPIYIFVLPSVRPRTSQSIWSRICEIDFLGFVLFVGAFTTGIMAISFGGALFAWNSSQIIGLFCGSGVLWILFGVQQVWTIMTTPDRRLFPVHLLKTLDMWILFAQTSISISELFISIYLIPLFFQFVHSDNALQAGVKVLPMIIVGVIFSVISGAVIGKLGYYMPWYLAGSALVVVGTALMRTVGPDTATANVYGYSVILLAGVGCYAQASFPIAQAKARKEDIPAAVAMIGCAQIGGLTVAFAIAYSIFLNTATVSISQILPDEPHATVQAAIAGVGAEFFATLPDGVRREVLQAIANSIGDVYDQLLATGVFSVVLSLFMKRERLFLKK